MGAVGKDFENDLLPIDDGETGGLNEGTSDIMGKMVQVYRTRAPGTSSRYLPPKEWPAPVVKLRNDILNPPPTFASRSWRTGSAFIQRATVP